MWSERRVQRRTVHGSATVPGADSGVAPDSRSAENSTSVKPDERCFRRDARAPRTALAKFEAVVEAGREVRRARAETLPKMKGGLRALDRTLEIHGTNSLKTAHAALDSAVLAASSFSAEKVCSPNSSP